MDQPQNTVILDSEHTVHESDHNDHLDPAGLHEIILDSSNELLGLQVHAFLEASDEVDIDAEIIEDILEVVSSSNPEESMNENGVQTQNSPHSVIASGEDIASDHEVPRLSSVDEHTESSNEGGETWTKQEIKDMQHFLKERGTSEFIERFVRTQSIPIPKLLEAFGVDLCPELRNRKPRTMLYFLRVAMNHLLRKRDKLPQYNTIDDAVSLIQKSQRILILTGAGISVSCGIPDFRSRDGLYASLKSKGEYDLDDPQQMFDINYFRENPAVFYSFASQIYPSNFVPSPCHRFIKLIEDRGKLLRNYTQNIDTLETLAGVKNVLQCHGSFATASCLQCRRKVNGKEIEADILTQKVPLCTVCNTVSSVPIQPKKKRGKKKAKGQWDSEDEDESDGPEFPSGIMKPDITFFGEKLTDDFDHSLAADRFKVDLLLIIGTSLKVSPVAEITTHLPHSIPQILINKTPVSHINPDIVLLGNADEIVLQLCNELSWELPPPTEATQTTMADASGGRLNVPAPRANLKKRPSEDSSGTRNGYPKRVGESHVWLFEGAEGGKWLQNLQRELGISNPRSVPSSAVNSGYNTRSSTPHRSPATKDANGGDGKRETKKARVV
ncbi:DHS-like NAD/FAD-binding domain-containing protein [Panaeolus papilionaceus]|nr:DHS-like NAD/FAD-binding domain-containing protein [Panaeolus papilionaceus]